VTLIYGDHDAVLVDTFLTIEQNERLVDWVKGHGRRLTHIFLTHGHADHVYGIEQVLQAFPDAQAVATAGAVARPASSPATSTETGSTASCSPVRSPNRSSPPRWPVTPSNSKGTSYAPSRPGTPTRRGRRVLWCPSLRLLVAGDVVYNRTPSHSQSYEDAHPHPMGSYCNGRQLKKWVVGRGRGSPSTAMSTISL